MAVCTPGGVHIVSEQLKQASMTAGTNDALRGQDGLGVHKPLSIVAAVPLNSSCQCYVPKYGRLRAYRSFCKSGEVQYGSTIRV